MDPLPPVAIHFRLNFDHFLPYTTSPPPPHLLDVINVWPHSIVSRRKSLLIYMVDVLNDFLLFFIFDLKLYRLLSLVRGVFDVKKI